MVPPAIGVCRPEVMLPNRRDRRMAEQAGVAGQQPRAVVSPAPVRQPKCHGPSFLLTSRVRRSNPPVQGQNDARENPAAIPRRIRPGCEYIRKASTSPSTVHGEEYSMGAGYTACATRSARIMKKAAAMVSAGIPSCHKCGKGQRYAAAA